MRRLRARRRVRSVLRLVLVVVAAGYLFAAACGPQAAALWYGMTA